MHNLLLSLKKYVNWKYLPEISAKRLTLLMSVTYKAIDFVHDIIIRNRHLILS